MKIDKPQTAVTERQQTILAMTETSGFVTIEGLAEAFGVSTQTVRRDIIALSDAGLLQRFHGGAGVAEQVETLRLDHAHKSSVSADAKLRVAKATAALLPTGASCFLDVGTTMEATAAVLNQQDGYRIFTNSMRVALAFDPSRHDVNVLGRRMGGKDGSLVGEEIILSLQELRVDYALIGCSAVDHDGNVMDYDLSKVAVKKAALKAAQNRFLLATPNKFGRVALSIFASVTDFDHVIDGTTLSTRTNAKAVV